MVSLVGTVSFFKEPIHLKTLGFHATEYGQAFLTTRFFEMGRERRVRRSRLVSLSTDELNPFASHNRIFGELIHADARCEWSVLTTSLAGSTSNAISASLSLGRLTFRHTELIFWHPNDVSGSCHVVFWPRNSKYHFWGQNGTTSLACKIVNFNPKHLKLWNHVFQTVYFKNMWKKISLHRHFKQRRS